MTAKVLHGTTGRFLRWLACSAALGAPFAQAAESGKNLVAKRVLRGGWDRLVHSGRLARDAPGSTRRTAALRSAARHRSSTIMPIRIGTFCVPRRWPCSPVGSAASAYGSKRRTSREASPGRPSAWSGRDGTASGRVVPTRPASKAREIGLASRQRPGCLRTRPSCFVACYVRQGMTGTAWFDGVEVVRIADPPMQSVLLSPVYRGRVTSEGKEARMRVRWNLLDHDLKPHDLRVHAALLRQGRKLRETAGRPSEGDPRYLDLIIPLANLEPGRYDLAVRLEGGGRKRTPDRLPCP